MTSKTAALRHWPGIARPRSHREQDAQTLEQILADDYQLLARQPHVRMEKQELDSRKMGVTINRLAEYGIGPVIESRLPYVPLSLRFIQFAVPSSVRNPGACHRSHSGPGRTLHNNPVAEHMMGA